MINREKAAFFWSGGKDSALALQEILKTGQFQITDLITTINIKYRRVFMHGIRESLLENQAQSLKIPLKKIYVPDNSSNTEYEKIIEKQLFMYKYRGIKKVVFGDIFQLELRKYRESQFALSGFDCVFPLWGKDTKSLVHSFVNQGFKSVITCIDGSVLQNHFKRILDMNIFT